MEIEEQASLQSHNSFGLDAQAAYFCSVKTIAELNQALDFANTRQIPACVLGEGSNVLFTGDYPGIVVQMAMTGIDMDKESGRVRIAAGENWHGVVQHCMNSGLHGLENLALIPGSTGAAPVQNIGAYGVELASFVESVEVLDAASGDQRQIAAEKCDFAYRDSVFKQPEGANLLITSVTLKLKRTWEPNTRYAALEAELPEKEPSALQLFDAVCRIRRRKLPDPSVIGNAGSFFKNPLVSRDKLEKLRSRYPDLVWFDSDEPDFKKLPAAWLLDKLGWKGKHRGSAAVSPDHALVLINPGAAKGEDVYLLAQEMSSSVLDAFGIALQPEVRII